ncbi:branched-chain amino acid ABC transporter permease [Paenibacillus frigoriresistens]|uniref:branched-chain amino acid ABC transporter permease n=1 Tax=Paenibacillus alginolyticus TaxID=59839 RepID=UPI0015630EAB|nr:branched-chain amino acid ABC transporter permease [Paenibacillus frigoriresistens]NRF94376.1 branched-chain amino acid ABC transporter permease [Paenibacillus frigoriresistens]
MRERRDLVILAVFVTLLLVLPLFINSYFLAIMILIAIAVIGATGINILTGYTGEISLGHGAFLAIGAYATALYGKHLALPFWLVLPMAGLTVAVVGCIIAIPAIRLRGLYLAIATFSLQMLVEHVFRNWSLTGKSNGISAPVASFGQFEFSGEHRFYYLAVIVSGLMVFFAWNVTRSRVGRAWLAIREKDLAAAALGIPITFYKIQAYMLSSFFAGIAGGLMAYYYGYVAPDFFTLAVSVQYLSMILVGGLGTIYGSVVGACFVVLIPEGLRLTTNIMPKGLSVNLLELQQVIYGLIIIVVILFANKGLAGLWTVISNHLKRIKIVKSLK